MTWSGWAGWTPWVDVLAAAGVGLLLTSVLLVRCARKREAAREAAARDRVLRNLRHLDLDGPQRRALDGGAARRVGRLLGADEGGSPMP